MSRLGLATPQLRSSAFADRLTSVRLSLVVEPLFQDSNLLTHNTNKKATYKRWFFYWYARRDSNPGPTD